MDDILPTEIATAPIEETVTAPQPPPEPTKDVKTFWERLDEVLALNLESKQMRDRVETLLEEFPTSQSVIGQGKSFLFQPERITISSNDDVQPPVALAQYGTGDPQFVYNVGASEYFSTFRIRLKRALVNVKSIQLLSAVIPNAVQNIPDNSTYFFYYKIRDLGTSLQGPWNALVVYDQGDIVTDGGNPYVCHFPQPGVQPSIQYWNEIGFIANASVWNSTQAYLVGQQVTYDGKFYQCLVGNTGIIPGLQYWLSVTLPGDLTLPNYWDISLDTLQFVKLLPSGTLFEEFPAPLNNPNFINRTFTDYTDLLQAIQFCATQPATASIPNDVTFQYNPTLNKFIFVPSLAANYYYFPAGFEDENVTTSLFLASNIYPTVNWSPGYTLNLRLGFTWNGIIPDPFLNDPYASDLVSNVLYAFMRPIDPRYLLPPYVKSNWGQEIVTANNYGDLVNTSCVRVYTDIVMGSTQDSNNKNLPDAEGLLSIVPVNATNTGVAFYQNNFNNELTKIPNIITEIGIRMVNDQGLPFALPNSATVLLELGVTYN